MLRRILFAVLNGVITYVVLLIIVVILGKVGLGDIGSIIANVTWAIAILVAALTFLGAIPSYWRDPV